MRRWLCLVVLLYFSHSTLGDFKDDQIAQLNAQIHSILRDQEQMIADQLKTFEDNIAVLNSTIDQVRKRNENSNLHQIGLSTISLVVKGGMLYVSVTNPVVLGGSIVFTLAGPYVNSRFFRDDSSDLVKKIEDIDDRYLQAFFDNMQNYVKHATAHCETAQSSTNEDASNEPNFQNFENPGFNYPYLLNPHSQSTEEPSKIDQSFSTLSASFYALNKMQQLTALSMVVDALSIGYAVNNILQGNPSEALEKLKTLRDKATSDYRRISKEFVNAARCRYGEKGLPHLFSHFEH